MAVCGCLWAQDETGSDDGNAAHIIKEEHRHALRQLILKADSGDAKAMFDLARILDIGYDSIPVDSIRSIALYREAARKGYAPARNYLGFRYYTGEGVNKNVDSAIYWINLAANEGDITAAANLGYLLTEGEEIPRDTVRALYWLEKASRGGVVEAEMKFVDLMRPQWQELPADSALSLGIDFYSKNTVIAGFTLIEIASNAEIPQALALLGDAYSKGLGTPYDHHKSIEYFSKAAHAGNPSAQFILAELLEFFPDAIKGTDQSAEYWYQQAALNGITDAQAAQEALFEIFH